MLPMALGRAFIEVHADLKPFKKALSTQVKGLVTDTQKAVNDAVTKAVNEGGTKASGGGKGRRPKVPIIKPKLDTGDADKETKGFFRRFQQQGKKAWEGFIDGF